MTMTEIRIPVRWLAFAVVLFSLCGCGGALYWLVRGGG